MKFRRRREDPRDAYWEIMLSPTAQTLEDAAEFSWSVMDEDRHNALLHRSYLRSVHSPTISWVGPMATPRANPGEDVQAQIAEMVRAALDTPPVAKPRRYLHGGGYAGVLLLDPLIIRAPLTLDAIPAYVDRRAERETPVMQQMAVLVSDGVISVLEDEFAPSWVPTRLHRDPDRALEKLCLRTLTADPLERVRFARLFTRRKPPRYVAEATGLRRR